MVAPDLSGIPERGGARLNRTPDPRKGLGHPQHRPSLGSGAIHRIPGAADDGEKPNGLLAFSDGGGWCCRTGLNCRPLPYQGSALPLSYGSARRPEASEGRGMP